MLDNRVVQSTESDLQVSEMGTEQTGFGNMEVIEILVSIASIQQCEQIPCWNSFNSKLGICLIVRWI